MAETTSGRPPGAHEAGRALFLRRRHWFFAMLAVPFLASLDGAFGMALMYRWPHVSAPIYFFIVRPPFVWFAMLAPFMAFGLVALRWRWFALGCALWFIAFVATEEVLPCLRPFPGRARAQFQTAQAGYLSWLASGRAPAGTVNVPLKLVSWNVHEGQGDATHNVQQLARLEPDIVLTQEYGPGYHVTMAQAVAQSPVFRDYHAAGNRCTVLSRWPLERLTDCPLPPELGVAVRVHVPPGLSLVCLDVHLTAPVIKTQLLRGWSFDELSRAIVRSAWELRVLREAIDKYRQEGPVVLAGDFNLPPRYPDLRRACGELVDCFGRHGFGWGKTAPARLPAMRPDQIYVPPGSRVYYAAAVPTRWSDHYLALAEVAVPVNPLEKTHER